MLANFLNKLLRRADGSTARGRVWQVVALPAWVFVGFIVSELAVECLVKAGQASGLSLQMLDSSVQMFMLAASVYLVSLVVVIGLPWLVRRYRTTRADLGMTRLPVWSDLLLAPAGYVIYAFCASLLVYLVVQFVPGFNATQAQEVGFSNLVQRYEMVLAFITLVVIAPLAEETLFRGYLYGKLRKAVPLWVAIILTSALFGLLHGQWNVGLDVFVLSIVMCILRELTGSIWAGVLLHMIKNGLAFFILFIYPLINHTIGG